MQDSTVFSVDTIALGIIIFCFSFVFYISSSSNSFWKNFYKIIPGVLMCYLLPSLFNSFGIISDQTSNLYYVASRYLLPAALVLMTLSIDLKAVFNLGPKALIMFFTGTLGIIIG